MPVSVTVGFKGKVSTFVSEEAMPKSKRAQSAVILDEWLAFHAAAVVGEDLGDYGFDEWDIIRGTVSAGSGFLMFAARPCNGHSALFTVKF